MNSGGAELDEFLRGLDSIGEDEVRRRLVSGVYGARKRQHVEAWLRRHEQTRAEADAEREHSLRQSEVLVARSSARATWIATALAGVSLIVSAGAIWMSWNTSTRAQREVLTLNAALERSPYNSEARRFLPGLLPGLIDSYWAVTVVNNGEKTSSVMDFNVERIHNRSIQGYTGIYGGLFDDRLRPIRLPIVIEPGHSVRFLVMVRAPLDSVATEFLLRRYPAGIPSLNRAADELAVTGRDFFGNHAEAIRHEGEIVGSSVRSEERQPTFRFSFTTGRGFRVLTEKAWYDLW